MKKKISIYILCSLLFGTTFVYWPRGSQDVTVYNTCSAEVCEAWYSSGTKVPVNGIPYKTYLGSEDIEGGRIGDAEALIRGRNSNIGINVLTGISASIVAVSIFYINKSLKKSTVK